MTNEIYKQYQIVKAALESLILRTPSGYVRNLLTDANIALLIAEEASK